jgi:ParB family chromosome partitioning protein
MKDRRYGDLPVDRIVVPLSRTRGRNQFDENVRSIKDVGLLKPILVNERFTASTGTYELVCGEGRLLAHKELGKPTIAAELIDCDRKEATLLSLVENIARIPAGTLWFAREVKRMRDEGMSFAEIGRIVGRSESYVADHISLVERGEERLIKGVDQGMFPMSLAIRIAQSNDKDVQHLLMDAFDQGVVTIRNLRVVREVIEERFARLGIRPPAALAPADPAEPAYTVSRLSEDIARAFREKKSFIRQAQAKEGMLISLYEGLKSLAADAEFLGLLGSEGLSEMPKPRSLGGTVRIE